MTTTEERKKQKGERIASTGILARTHAAWNKSPRYNDSFMRVLFGNPTSVVRESLESVMRRLAGGHDDQRDFLYVGVQIRLGGENSSPVLGWVDPSRHSLEQVQCFAAEAVRLCRQMRIRSIFVTADSEEAVRAFEEAVDRESASASSSPSPRPIVVQSAGYHCAHRQKQRTSRARTSSLAEVCFGLVDIKALVGSSHLKELFW